MHEIGGTQWPRIFMSGGAPLSVVQDALGHRKEGSVESTRVYARTTGSMFKAIRHPVSEFRLG